MEIEKILNKDSLIIKLSGRLDAITAPELSNVLSESLDGIKNLTIDLEKLGYIASSGLRVLLVTQKRMNKQGSMKVLNVCDAVKEVLDMTGFSNIIKIM